ncbi:signal peptidase, endoplasmic reticulum-type [Halovenus aranensis]|jgi:signal peptidase|uniref:Signal peptidase, endoplasmic reticulum-type n=1 Tax=Halovenus aranensis TaxID=890420 RepID=A0A1G8VVV4_9EURY|nr:S26 family signal peptidase [Halovenus aranensis]SDJ69380.1 signal peptidase, endoplasmic reticulum-type [Halovenus aranensis]
MTAPGDEETDAERAPGDAGASPTSGNDPPEDVEDSESDTDGVHSAALAEGYQSEDLSRPPAVGRGGTPRPTPATEESSEWVQFVRDIVTSVVAVLLLGAYLFAISGVWPPMVAIESGSMEPNMEVNDLVILMETERFQPAEAHGDTGVVTAAVGNETGYGSHGGDGDVIVFNPDGNEGTTPIIHRAMFWVEEGENWCAQANQAYLGSLDPDDEECVAPNDGFITKGDNNGRYDQASLQATRPVKPEWVVGTAEARIPGLGWFRLRFQ